MALNVPSGILGMLQSGVSTVCLCWKLTRPDNVVMGFTDHDEDVGFDSVTYLASSSFTASAMEDQLGLAVSNLDVMAAFSSETITNDDLEDGRYDNSVVEIWLVDWTDPQPDTNRVMIRSCTLGQVQAGDLAYQAEFRSLAQHYAQYIGAIVQPKCRSELGDTGKGLEGGCRFTLPAPVNGTIQSIVNRNSFKISAAGSFPDNEGGTIAGGFFAFGTVTALTGKNKGVSKEVSTSDPALNIVVAEAFPEDFQVGDSVQLQIGCDHTPETCRIIFNNLVNFRAEPYVPGTDQVFKVNS